jgi:SAM-dependent methyltransferase
MRSQSQLNEMEQTPTEDGAVRNAIPNDIQLRCPHCGSNVDELMCLQCAFGMKLHNGIVHALPLERAAHYARFISDYERIRAAEGRRSSDSNFYLSLPYTDTSGRNSAQWAIRSRSYGFLIRHVFKSLCAGARILDLGSGNCWMSYRLALRGYRPVAVDLLTNGDDGLGAACHYESQLKFPFSRFQAEATNLPFHDGQFDAVVFNASFHYSENYETTLLEALRCLKPAGMIVVSDTPWYSREESGRQMVAERQAHFRERFGTASNSIRSMEYLTDVRLNALEQALPIRWTSYTPWYGWQWAMRPVIATLCRRREPSRFRIYVGHRHE